METVTEVEKAQDKTLEDVEEEYEENEEELEMIMTKGNRSYILLEEVLANTTKSVKNIVLARHTLFPYYLSK